MNKVECGANSMDVEAAGKTVATIREELKDSLNLPENPKVYVNHELVEDDQTVINEGDSVEFVKEAGDKG